MRTVVLDPVPVEVEDLIDRRRALGLDRHDEVWEGVYHMVPGPSWRHAHLDQQLGEVLGPLARQAGLVPIGEFNLGAENDFRVPDRGAHRGLPTADAVYLPTVALVVEIVSPGDETYAKLPFHAGHQVEEVLVVRPDDHRVSVLHLTGGTYSPADRSHLLGIDAREIEARIRWP